MLEAALKAVWQIQNVLPDKPVTLQPHRVSAPPMMPVNLPLAMVTNAMTSVPVSPARRALETKTAMKVKFVTLRMPPAALVFRSVLVVPQYTAASTNTVTQPQANATKAAAMSVTASLVMFAKTAHVFLVTAQPVQPARM